MQSTHSKVKIEVEAGSFTDGQPIPREHSAYFEGISPELRWSGVPEGTASVALICEDPDAPREPSFVHWLIADMPLTLTSLPRAIPKEDRPDTLQGGVQGVNDKGITGYYGPRPPAGTGTHHYHFHILALDAPLNLPPGFDRAQFQEAVRDHVIGQGSVVGTFSAPE